MAKRILILYSGGESAELQHWAKTVIRSLQQSGAEVECLAPPEYSPEKNVRHFKLAVLGRVRQGWGYWLWLSVVMPVHILILALSRNYRSVVSFDPHLSLFTYILITLRAVQRVVFIQKAPWNSLKRKERLLPIRNFLYFRDCFGLMTAHRVIVPTAYVADQILSEISFLKQRVVALAYSTDNVLEHKELQVQSDNGSKEKQFKAFRESLIEQYDLPERALLLATMDELVEQQPVERLVRALSAADVDRICLFVLGSGPERISLLAIVIGLGLVDRVIFVDDRSVFEKVLLGSDVYVVCSEAHGMRRSLMQAFAVGLPVLAIDNPEMREVLNEERLLLSAESVEDIAQELRELSQSRSKFKELREISQNVAKQYQYDWGQRAAGMLGVS